MAIDSQPKLRSVVERRLGSSERRPGARAGQRRGPAWASPLPACSSTARCGVHRCGRLRAAPCLASAGARVAWHAAAGAGRARRPRTSPSDCPTGPYERYAKCASFASAAGLAGRRGDRPPRRGSGSRWVPSRNRPGSGGKGHAAALGQVLARRGVLVMQPEVLRLLDRVDTVVLDPQALWTGNLAVGSVVALSGASAEEARLTVDRLFRPGAAGATRAAGRLGAWSRRCLAAVGAPGRT